MLNYILKFAERFGESNFFVACVVVAVLLTGALFLEALSCGGYYRKIRKAVQRTDKFVSKNLMIKRDNESFYFTECLSELPPEYRRSWRAFAENGIGRAGDCFPPAAYLTKVAATETERATLVYSALSVALIVGEIIWFLVQKTALNFAVGAIAIQIFLAFSGLVNYRLKRLAIIKKTPRKMEELATLLNRFVNLKPLSQEKRVELKAIKPIEAEPVKEAIQ